MTEHCRLCGKEHPVQRYPFRWGTVRTCPTLGAQSECYVRGEIYKSPDAVAQMRNGAEEKKP